jgi:nicotinamide-nucleotide amidase
MSKLDAEIVTIGDELNRGEIVDTNSAWLAEQLTELGLHVRWRTSVTDDAPDMEEALRRAAGRARVVCCSGGLGPTEDDRTVDVVSALVGTTPVEEPAHAAKMAARFATRAFAITPNNARQVRVPSGAAVYPNGVGLAPGFGVRLGDAELFFMPGVPREMRSIFDEGGVRARVVELAGAQPLRSAMRKRTWRVVGMGESHVDHALRGLLDGVADATLHFRIAFPECLVTVVVRRAEAAEAEAVLARLDGEVRRRLAGNVYGTDGDTLAKVIGERLVARGETVAVAESCTGGMLGQLLTTVPGSSRWFPGGVIAYANAVKEALVGVRGETLAAHGAVSEETVREMAAGVRARLGTTWGMAISGIAGPDGGTAEKPVGTVHIAVAGPNVVEARKLLYPNEREMVRTMAAFSAMHLLWKNLT